MVLGMEHFRPRDSCVPKSTCPILTLTTHHHLVLHHHRLDRFVALGLSSPLSSHLKCHTVRPPSPADARSARRFDSRHSNVTHDVHDSDFDTGRTSAGITRGIYNRTTVRWINNIWYTQHNDRKRYVVRWLYTA